MTEVTSVDLTTLKEVRYLGRPVSSLKYDNSLIWSTPPSAVTNVDVKATFAIGDDEKPGCLLDKYTIMTDQFN